MSIILPRLTLAMSGILLLVIGSAVLFNPASFATANGMALPDNPSYLSEYRAPGGMLTASGLFLLFAAVRTYYLRMGFALAALVYGSYGISRLVAVAVDGMPSAALTQAMVIELLVGAVCLTALFALNQRENRTGQR